MQVQKHQSDHIVRLRFVIELTAKALMNALKIDGRIEDFMAEVVVPLNGLRLMKKLSEPEFAMDFDSALSVTKISVLHDKMTLTLIRPDVEFATASLYDLGPCEVLSHEIMFDWTVDADVDLSKADPLFRFSYMRAMKNREVLAGAVYDFSRLCRALYEDYVPLFNKMEAGLVDMPQGHELRMAISDPVKHDGHRDARGFVVESFKNLNTDQRLKTMPEGYWAVSWKDAVIVTLYLVDEQDRFVVDLMSAEFKSNPLTEQYARELVLHGYKQRELVSEGQPLTVGTFAHSVSRSIIERCHSLNLVRREAKELEQQLVDMNQEIATETEEILKIFTMSRREHDEYVSRAVKSIQTPIYEEQP